MATSRASASRAAVDVTFEELYRGHRADVFRDALRELGNVHDAEDVTQAAFVDAYRAVLRGTQPQSPRAWLLAIAENVRRRKFRTAQRRPRELPLDEDFPLAADLPSEQAEALVDALGELPLEQRRVFVLREIAGLSYDEIAAEVDSSVASVQMLLFRARRSLREQLEPPVVARRRTGLLVPMPGWLASLASKVELAGLTPRVAGATGATALVVLGASVAVPQAPADIPRLAHARAQPAAVAPGRVIATRPGSRPASAGVVASRKARPSIQMRGGKVARGAAQTVTPATGPPGPAVAPAAAAPSATASGPVAAAAGPVAAAVPAQVPARTLPAVLSPRVADVLAQPPLTLPPVPSVSVPSVPVPQLPAAPLPVQVPAPPALPTPAQAVEVATGAVSAAGADALPLPVPALPPPVALPPTP